MAGESPWGWRDAVVTAMRGLEVTVEYVTDEGRPVLWHHRPLEEYVAVGDPVRMHERYSLMDARGHWFSVRLADGLGPVADPDHPELWLAETTVAVVDHAAGVGLPVEPS
jgi:hypothetical protein